MILNKKTKCAIKGCERKPSCIIRTKNMCKFHFWDYRIDNLKRHRSRLDIPKNLRLLE